MTKRNWKKVRPQSLRRAMELCLEHARERHLSVDRVAELMGLSSKWALYKWLESGRMPAVLIRPFEHACGIDLVTQYLAYSAHKLLVDIPDGHRARDTEINDLQGSFHAAVGALIQFYQGNADASEALAEIHTVMSDLAFHRENVAKAQAPELALFEVEEE